jgi:long-chain fatty acid transport protein
MKKWLVCIAFVHVFGSTAFAASVDTFGIGAKATSMGGAVCASSADVFSVYYNPASLSQLKEAQISAAIQMCDPDLTFHGYTVSGGEYANGTDMSDIGPKTFSDDSDNLYIPTLGYAQPITKDISFGIAAYVPFGLDVKWERDPAKNPGVYNWFHSYYVREVVTPTLSYKVNDKVAIGAGASFGKSKSGAEKILNYPGQSFNGAKLKLELEDSFNYSFNAGVLYKPIETCSLGLTFRGRADAEFEGDVFINGVKQTKAKMDYDHPEQIQAGVMVKPVKDVTLELDVVWTNWSINHTQSTYFSSPLLGSMNEEILERNWNDTNQVRVGAEWQVNDLLALRCGYFYDPSPVPDDTFDIMWPDADRKTYSIGAGFNFGNWVLDTSIQFAYAETKRIIGGESENLNDPYNPYAALGIYDGYTVKTSADGYLWGYGASITYKF